MLLAVPLIVVLPVHYSVPIVGMMLIMTLLPNKEVAISFLGRRSFTHTVWFAFFMTAVVFGSVYTLLSLVEVGIQELGGVVPDILQPRLIAGILALGTFLGISSHLLGDVLVGGASKPTPKPFWPIIRVPIQFGVASERNPWVNEGLFRLMCFVVFVLYLIRLGVRPIFIY